MQEAENDSVNIRLYGNGIAAEVDFYHNGVVIHKAISLEDLTQCFLRSQESNRILFNGLLPAGLISHYDSPTEKYYVLRYPAQKITYTYIFSETPYLNFPMPDLVFGILMNKDNMILRTFLRVLPQGKLKPDSPLYYYPFSNVYPDGEICMGHNEALIYSNLQSLENYPDYILSLPNNNDLFRTNYNKQGKNQKALLDTLAKRNPDFYYGHVLVQVPGQTLKDFCTMGGNIK